MSRYWFMRNSVVIAGYLFLIILVSSCGKTTCLNPGFRVIFKGFDSTDLSRVLITQYTSNTNFATLIGIRVFDSAYTQTVQSNDTVYMPVLDTSGLYIAPGYDYIISLPKIAHTSFADSSFKISGLSYHQVSKKSKSNGGCTNDAYYYLDSLPYKMAGSSFTQTNLPPVTIILNK